MTAPPVYRAAFALACAAALLPTMPGRFDPVLHRGELLFGFVPVLLLGFMIVSLPRWLGRPFAPAWAMPGLVLVHAAALACRAAGIPGTLAVQALAAAGFAAVLAANVLAARAWRSLYPAVLVSLHSGMAVAAWAGAALATEAAMACVVLLCLEIGNRIAFALSSAAGEVRGRAPLGAAPAVLAWTERAVAATALAGWAVGSPPVLAACVAVVAGAVRIACLRPWTLAWAPGVLAVVCGLAFVYAGFGLIVLSGLGLASASACVHAWGIGSLGLLATSVVASILRKKERRPFTRCPAAEAAWAAVTLAALCRLFADFSGGAAPTLIAAARVFWTSAFAACFALVLRGAFERSSCRRSA